MDVRFHWDAATLALLHRQRTRRMRVLQSISIPVLGVGGLAWLVLRTGSLASLWSQAALPVLALVVLCLVWPVHIGWLHARHAHQAARDGAGDWCLSLVQERLRVEHQDFLMQVPCSIIRAVQLPAGMLLSLRVADVAVPAGEPARHVLRMLGQEAGPR